MGLLGYYLCSMGSVYMVFIPLKKLESKFSLRSFTLSNNRYFLIKSHFENILFILLVYPFLAYFMLYMAWFNVVGTNKWGGLLVTLLELPV